MHTAFRLLKRSSRSAFLGLLVAMLLSWIAASSATAQQSNTDNCVEITDISIGCSFEWDYSENTEMVQEWAFTVKNRSDFYGIGYTMRSVTPGVELIGAGGSADKPVGPRGTFPRHTGTSWFKGGEPGQIVQVAIEMTGRTALDRYDTRTCEQIVEIKLRECEGDNSDCVGLVGLGMGCTVEGSRGVNIRSWSFKVKNQSDFYATRYTIRSLTPGVTISAPTLDLNNGVSIAPGDRFNKHLGSFITGGDPGDMIRVAVEVFGTASSSSPREIRSCESILEIRLRECKDDEGSENNGDETNEENSSDCSELLRLGMGCTVEDNNGVKGRTWSFTVKNNADFYATRYTVRSLTRGVTITPPSIDLNSGVSIAPGDHFNAHVGSIILGGNPGDVIRVAVEMFGTATSNSPRETPSCETIFEIPLRQCKRDGVLVSDARNLHEGEELIDHYALSSVGHEGGDVRSISQLGQVWPNPATGTASLNMNLTSTESVSLVIRDAAGKEVTRLFDGETLEAGSHVVSFDVSELSSGTYFYTLETGTTAETKKMTVTK